MIKVTVKNGIMRIYGLTAGHASVVQSSISYDARWHGKWQCWNVPMTFDSVDKLSGFLASHGGGQQLPQAVSDWLREQRHLAVVRAEANKLKDTDPESVRQRMINFGFRFKRDLFPHQVVTAAYALKLPTCGVFLDTGTGKTATLSTVMQGLYDKLGFRKFLVMAPKSILGASWAADIAEFSWLKSVNISDPPEREPVTVCPICQRQFKAHVSWQHLRTHVTKFIEKNGEERAKEAVFEKKPELRPPGADSKQDRLKRALASDADVFLINPESFRLAFDDIVEVDWDMFIVDESSCLKGPKSQITKATLELGAQVKRRIAATATPRPNSSLDFWGQMAFIDMALGGNFYAFREKYYYKDYTGFRWLPKSSKIDEEIRDIVFQRAIHYKLDDCVNLPGETFETRSIDIGTKLRAAYEEMKKSMQVTLANGDVVSTEWLVVQLNKLSQITSGFVIAEDGSGQWLDTESPKIRETLRTAKQLIEDEDRSVVIWIRYQEEAKTLERELAGYGVSTMHGGTKNHEANAEAFKKGRNRVMIAHPASAKFGHTWVEHCNIAIFHSYDYSFENWYQARRRIYRIGQKRPVTYLTMVADGTIDEEIIKAITAKKNDHEAVVEGNVIALLMKSLSEKR
jgi:SNF2 family DNA or RNA helicase